jgi:adenylyltransferase/sulfurtransferase
MLTQPELARYARHLSLPQVGQAGQDRLKSAAAIVVGAGALGSAASLYLAAAGIGRLGIIDADQVDSSNLQRQILHGESAIGQPKISSALARLADTNPFVTLEGHESWLTAANATAILGNYDIIIDGTDNFPARFLINDAAFFLRKPVVHASILRFEGQASIFAPHLGGPCYRCLLPVPPDAGAVPSCAEAGVFGALPGILGSMQAMEALKLLLGIGTPLLGRVLHYDALSARVREITLRKDPHCPLCGSQPTIRSLQDVDPSCGCPLSARPAATDVPEITCDDLRRLLDGGWDGLLVDVREASEHAAGHIGGSRLIPLKRLPEACEALREMSEAGKDIIVHCQAGGRSAQAVLLLQKAGLHGVRHLHGGFSAWAKAKA